MITSPNGIFFTLLAVCEGNPRVTGGFPSQRPVTRNFDVFFDLLLNKQLNKQLRRRWFETQSRSLWRHYNDWFRVKSPGDGCFQKRKSGHSLIGLIALEYWSLIKINVDNGYIWQTVICITNCPCLLKLTINVVILINNEIYIAII